MAPKVSVIIPVYNGERYIRSTVESVLCQTFGDFELIVVDDGSTDRSKEIVQDIKGPLIYVYQENSGTAAARNRGFLDSQGDYIAFLDQDDRWYPQKLAAQVRQLDENPQLGVVYSDIDLIDEAENILEHGHLRNWKESPEQGAFLGIFSEYPRPDPYPSAALMRREIFSNSGMFDPAFKRNCFEDVDLWFRMVKKNLGQFFFHEEPLVQIRRHPLQGGRNKQAWEENWLLCSSKLLQLYSDDPRIFELRRKLACMFQDTGKRLIREGNDEQGRMYLKKALNCYPVYVENLVNLIGAKKEVLAAGPANTCMTQALSKLECSVTSININPELSYPADAAHKQLLVGDIEQLDLDNKIDQKSFDVILLGDLLEYSTDPSEILLKLHRFLKPSGCLVVSVPNASHGSGRLALLSGEFFRREEDRLAGAPARFFTLRTVSALFRKTGYEICDLRRIRLGFFDTEIPLDPVKIPLAVLKSLLQDPEATTYYYVFRAVKAQSPADPGPKSELKGLLDPDWRPRRERRKLASDCRRRGITFYRCNRLSEARTILCKSLLLQLRAKTLMYLIASCVRVRGRRSVSKLARLER